jgi:hypothetical protein
VSLWQRIRSRRGTSDEQSSDRSSRFSGQTVADEQITGDRSISPTHRVRSAQSRVSTLLSVGMGALLIGGFLIWYYKHALADRSREPDGTSCHGKKSAGRYGVAVDRTHRSSDN